MHDKLREGEEMTEVKLKLQLNNHKNGNVKSSSSSSHVKNEAL